jgi:hypothetical protein
VAVFTAEWLQLNATEDRFMASTTQESHYEAIRDLVIGTLELLGQTPLRVMGLNRDFHYELGSEAERDEVGHRLAPQKDWVGVIDRPGLFSLTMQGQRPDPLAGYIRVKVEPSVRVANGVFVEVNDHYELASEGELSPGTGDAVRILTERWANSMQKSLTIAQRIAGLGESR